MSLIRKADIEREDRPVASGLADIVANGPHGEALGA